MGSNLDHGHEREILFLKVEEVRENKTGLEDKISLGAKSFGYKFS